MTESPMMIVGLMSGTSLDGVDAALVRVRSAVSVELVAYAHRPYSATERDWITNVLETGTMRDVAQLHALAAEWACDATELVLDAAHVRPDMLGAIAFPGQTVWHEPPRVTLQLGEPALLAERFGTRVVHSFRGRDVAAGGQGAPLVPIVDALCFASTEHPRILLNIGGMANVTWVDRGGDIETAVGADTGPGMVLIDAVARLVDPALPYDTDGVLSQRGRVDAGALEELLADPFYSAPPPRSTGREHFGRQYAEAIHRRVPGADGVRTAVALTAASIMQFCTAHLPPAAEIIVAGGGVRHPVLMALLNDLAAERKMSLARFDDLFFSGDAKEAVAFALLAWLTIHGQPGNLPRVTGAAGSRVLGAITPP